MSGSCEDQVALRCRVEAIQKLSAAAPLSAAAILINAGASALLVYDRVETHLLGLWLLAFSALAIHQLFRWRRLRGGCLVADISDRSIRRAIALAGVSGLLWGGYVASLIPQVGAFEQIGLMGMVIGLVAGGVVAYYRIPAGAVAFVTPALALPVTVFAWRWGGQASPILLMAAAYAGTVLIAINQGYRVFLNRIRNSLENEDLALQAEHAARAKSSFLARASHELRTPLNAIIGFSSLMLRGDVQNLDEVRRREFLEYVNEAGEQLLAMVNEILVAAELEASQRRLSKRQISPAGLIEEAISSKKEKASAKAIDMDLNLQTDLPPLLCDPSAVRSILSHLLDNAVKFTPAGGKVTIIGRHEPQAGLMIEVTDSGPGIAGELRPRLFSPFAGASWAMNASQEGLGLGLFIAQSLAGLHGAVIEALPGSGRGAVMRLTFPSAAHAV